LATSAKAKDSQGFGLQGQILDITNIQYSSSRGQNFGLSLKALPLASASNFWPWSGLKLQQKNQQSRRDGPVCLPTTIHHTMQRTTVSHDAASEQLHRYISVINNESFNQTATSAHLDKLSLDCPLL